MSVIERISNLQSLTSQIRGRMLGNLLQFENAKDNTPVDLSLDIVAGYLLQASEDACAVAEAMCSRYVSVHEVALLTEVSEKSFRDFVRAFQTWKEQCVN
jgi:hypothetical protein